MHGMAGLINTEGQLVVQPQYISIHDFKQGRAVAILQDDINVIIDTAGQIIKQVSYRILGKFHQGLARIKRKRYTDESGKRVESAVGFINQDGEVVIEPQFINAGDFPEDGLALAIKDKYWCYIDTSGAIIIHKEMNSAMDNGYSFAEGLVRFKENGWWGFKDKFGSWKILPFYDYAEDFKNGLARVQIGGKENYIDKNGNVYEPNPYTQLQPFSEGLALIQIDYRLAYINEVGNLAFNPPIFEKAESFSEGLACVKIDGKYGYINAQGKFVIPCQYLMAHSFKNGLAYVMTKEGYAYINQNNEMVWSSAEFKKSPLFHISLESNPSEIVQDKKEGVARDNSSENTSTTGEPYLVGETLRGETLPDGTQISPDGKYRIEFACNEMRMSHWVCAPKIIDTQTKAVILDLWHTSLWDGSASFTQQGEIILFLRKYPGTSPGIEIKINPLTLTYVNKNNPSAWLHLSNLVSQLA
jgi:hypothetical protein